MRSGATADREGDVQRRCERAIATAARAAGVGTRQQVRAAARGFVRRHRRDCGYLAFVLRSVLANSALAAILLGLAPMPANARATLFAERTGAANPLAGQGSGLASAPVAADLDLDGDLDVIVAAVSGSFLYYENTGTATSAVFIQRTGTANPLDGQVAGTTPVAALGDLDGDGDLDLVAGGYTGSISFFENTGSATLPAFVSRTGSANPLNGEDVGLYAAPAFGDLDGDGDLDLVAGEGDGVFNYYENTGSAELPAFVLRTGSANPLDSRDVGSHSAPAIADLDRDADLDLVVGEYDGVFEYFENTGSAVLAAFVPRTAAANPLAGQDVGVRSTPALGDLDGDHDLDLVAGKIELAAVLHYYENLSGDFVALTGAANPLDDDVLPAAGPSYTPTLGDLDADGDRDLVVGTSIGLLYFENTGSAASPAFAERTGAANPLPGQAGFLIPALGDVDRDGDLDLVGGDFDGGFHYFQNTGSAASPAFVERVGSANPLNGVDVGDYATPTLGDLDGDGDFDLVSGEADLPPFSPPFDLHYFENTGAAGAPAFIERIGAGNPFDGLDVGFFSIPTLGDVDGDGDLDLVAGGSNGSISFFENTGTASAGAFALRTGTANPLSGQYQFYPALGELDADGDIDIVAVGFTPPPSQFFFRYFENAIVRPAPRYSGPILPPFSGQDVGSYARPALGDLDADGDLDAVVGEVGGGLFLLENTSSALLPSFVERTGAQDPFHGVIPGGLGAKAALADLDADGDLDAASGQQFGGFTYFENTGTATEPDFVLRTSSLDDPLFALSTGYDSFPTFADLDADGDMDLVSSGNPFFYFENTGSASDPDFLAQTGAENPLSGLGDASFLVPAFADVDRDGDLDLVAGDPAGTFRYYENTGGATSPAFAARTGSANPLDGYDIGDFSAPATGDVDADGDPDLIAGLPNGTLRLFPLPEPSFSLLFGVGAGLVSWLERRRNPKSGPR